MTNTIRTLKPSEIELRAGMVKGNGCSLLLYKDARADMKILDETYGPMGWTRKHEIIGGNLYCTVAVWDQEKSQWIEKQDVGVESNAEAEKGQASDSFKRACFNFGIGRELYTSPFIWINLRLEEIDNYKGKPRLASKVKFKVSEISYNEDREINHLVIIDNQGQERYRLGSFIKAPGTPVSGKTNNYGKAVNKPPQGQARTPQGQARPSQPKPNPNYQPTTPPTTPESSDLTCSDCKVPVTQAVATYSSRYYGRSLCMNCQEKAKANR